MTIIDHKVDYPIGTRLQTEDGAEVEVVEGTNCVFCVFILDPCGGAKCLPQRRADYTNIIFREVGTDED